jgi:ribosome maturation factor RimP
VTQRGRTSAGRPSGPQTRARLRAAVESAVRPAGYDLEELTVSRAGRRHVVRVIVDGDGGVSLDTVADLSRAISVALDEAEESGGELTPGEYTLEVSSPGIDRPLTQPRHWRRNVGRLVKVKAGDRAVTGRILAADDDGVELDVDGERRAVKHGDLGPGRVQVDFSRVAELPDAEDEMEEGEDEE